MIHYLLSAIHDAFTLNTIGAWEMRLFFIIMFGSIAVLAVDKLVVRKKRY